MALLLPVAAQAMTYDQAVDKLVANGYPQKVENAIVSMGTVRPRVPLGRQPRRTTASAHYIAAQMQAMGLSDVALERVPLDAWSFHGARVQGERQDVTGVRVRRRARHRRHAGHAQGRLRRHGHAGGVRGGRRRPGKIVLVDFDGYDWWLNFPQMLAGYRGARGRDLHARALRLRPRR